ncbi:MAG: hypothetical protein ACHQNE_03910 [Candidatus Kapaibacterium sp.]
MGAIIYWGLVRFALVVLAAWALYGFIPNYGDWWTLFFVAVGVVVVYPAQLAWRKQEEVIRRANQNGLCATCKHFARREALCTRLDEHVRKDYTPCGGKGWEPLEIMN